MLMKPMLLGPFLWQGFFSTTSRGSRTMRAHGITFCETLFLRTSCIYFSRLKTPSRGLTKPEFLSDMHEPVTKGETLGLLWGSDKNNQTVMGEGSVLLARALVQVLKTDQ